MEYGAPIGFEGTFLECSIGNVTNHKGAREFEDGVWKYLNKEASYGAIVGPFDTFTLNMFIVKQIQTMDQTRVINLRGLLCYI